jgi:hypothetical protein
LLGCSTPNGVMARCRQINADNSIPICVVLNA